jgi:acyl dehydratase
VSEWDRLTQEDLDAFAAVTSVEWFVDVDVERAKQTPFCGTTARACYTRSLGRTSRR